MRLSDTKAGWTRQHYAFRYLCLTGHWVTAAMTLAWMSAMVIVARADPNWMDLAFWSSVILWLLFIVGCVLWFAAGFFQQLPDRN